MEKVSILGIEIDNLSLQETVEKIDFFIKKKQPALVVTANPEIIMLGLDDQEFKSCLKSADLITADGIGLIIAGKMLGTPIKERVTGIDLITALFRRAKERNYTFYFVGARPGVADKAAENIRRDFQGIKIVGVHHGYFDDDREIIADIKHKKPDIVLAALGMGKQEKWIRKRLRDSGVPVGIGVGGSFDVFAGEVKRAPLWMRKVGLEWLARLFQQPSRFSRVLKLPVFLVKVLIDKLKK